MGNTLSASLFRFNRFCAYCFGFLSLSLVILSCAGQVPPDGGPVDLEPPQILSTYPAPYTTQFRDNNIVLEFDEYVDRRSVEESIFISPFINNIEFDWTGREVEILFSESLRENRTYVVTVGTDVVDVNNRNRMAQAFTLAFSTGGAIDRGAISGRMYPAQSNEPPEGVMVFAYLQVPGAGDTLNPMTTKPDYITQTGKGGEFTFRHLAFGGYRVLAVRDEFRNLVYDPESDSYGVPVADIQVSATDTLHENLQMQLAKEDTTAPRLMKVTAQDRTHLLAEFSEVVDMETLDKKNFSISDTANNSTLEVLRTASLLSKPTTVKLLIAGHDAARPYRLVVERVRDLAGNEVNTLANALTFESSDKADTTKPTISSFSQPDSTRGVGLQPAFLISFSDFMDSKSVENAIILRDSVRNIIRTTLQWKTDSDLEIVPRGILVSAMWYTLTVNLPEVKNVFGTPGPDGTRVFKFETVDLETLSSIEGVLRDRNRSDTAGSVFIAARNIDQKDGKDYTVQLNSAENFSMTNLPEGQYILRAFRDRDGNGKYDAGRPFPFSPSERFAVYPDTLKLRPRWPLEGVRVELR